MSMEPILTDDHYKKAEENGISKRNLYNRVYNLMWPIERAINEPLKSKDSKYGEWLETAKENGIYTELFHSRLRQGWDIEKAATEPIKKSKATEVDIEHSDNEWF